MNSVKTNTVVVVITVMCRSSLRSSSQTHTFVDWFWVKFLKCLVDLMTLAAVPTGMKVRQALTMIHFESLSLTTGCFTYSQRLVKKLLQLQSTGSKNFKGVFFDRNESEKNSSAEPASNDAFSLPWTIIWTAATPTHAICLIILHELSTTTWIRWWIQQQRWI